MHFWLLSRSIFRMAITSSAKKAIRASSKKRIFNVRRKRALAETVKALKKALVSGGVSEAEKLIPATYKAIDKAAKRGVIKANTASRKKSRLISAIRRTEAKNKE